MNYLYHTGINLPGFFRTKHNKTAIRIIGKIFTGLIPVLTGFLCPALTGCTSLGSPSVSQDEEILDYEEYKSIASITVKENFGQVTAIMGKFLPENPVSGLIGGTIAGFVGGFHPYALMAGGPLISAPVLGGVMAACGAAVAHAKDPLGNLQTFVANAGLDQFRNSLDTRLQVSIMSGRSEIEESTPDQPADTVLEILKLTVVLDGNPPADGYVCHPQLSATTEWRAFKIANNKLLRAGTTAYRLTVSDQNFRDWFMDTEKRKVELDLLLEKLGQETANDFLFRD